MNGKSAQLTLREVRQFFSHPLYVMMMIVLCGVIVLIGPYDHLLNFSALRLAIFYANCFSSFMAAILLAYALVDRLGWTAYSTVIAAFGGLASSFWGTVIALALGAEPPPLSEAVLLTGFNLVFCFLGDLIVATFFFNRIVADLVAARSKGDDPQVDQDLLQPMPKALRLFGQLFQMDDLRLLQAEEHYVRVTLADGSSHLLRGRISDAEAVLSTQIGLRIHRSHWVAASAIQAFRQDRGEAFVLTTDGKKLAVARHRIPEVRAWAQKVLAPQEKRGAAYRPPITTESKPA